MIELSKTKISNLGEVVGGGTPSTADKNNYSTHGIGWITPKDLAEHPFRYIERGERDISEHGLKSSSARLLPAGTILFSSRAPIGYVAIAKNQLTTNQGFRSIIPNDKVVPEFLYYLLKFNKNKIEKNAGGSTFKEISGSTLSETEVIIPLDIKTQKSIADLLGYIDSKIEANIKINDNLSYNNLAI